jgi:hypothetical protein
MQQQLQLMHKTRAAGLVAAANSSSQTHLAGGLWVKMGEMVVQEVVVMIAAEMAGVVVVPGRRERAQGEDTQVLTLIRIESCPNMSQLGVAGLWCCMN